MIKIKQVMEFVIMTNFCYDFKQISSKIGLIKFHGDYYSNLKNI